MISVAVLVTVGPSPLALEEAVFLDGRTLPLAGYSFHGERVTLELEGGGRLTVPRSRLRIIRSADPPPAPKETPAPLGVSPPPPPRESLTPASPGTLSREERLSPDALFSRIAELALENELDTLLVAAVVLVESGLDPGAVSPKGAKGLMQLMPLTASHYGVTDPFDPVQNLEAGITHLKVLLDRYQGDLELALAAFNAGDAAVERYGGVPPYPETRRFVNRVLSLAGTR